MKTTTPEEIDTLLACYPAPNRPYDAEARRNWALWRVILDKIVNNKHYRYNDPQKYVLLNMARFASEMMGKYNYLTYKTTR